MEGLEEGSVVVVAGGKLVYMSGKILYVHSFRLALGNACIAERGRCSSSCRCCCFPSSSAVLKLQAD